MDYYQELLKALGNTDDVDYLFSTGRAGSRYATHKDMSSTGFRTPSNRPQTEAPSLQKRSYKTFYASPDVASKLQGFLDNELLGTKLTPAISNGKLIGVNVISTSNINFPEYRASPNAPVSLPARSYKEGQVLATLPVSSVPEIGLHPIEFGQSGFESPVGTRAVSERKLHIGTNITDVQRPRLAGKAGIAAALAGGAGAASAGDLRQAAGNLAESLLPLGLTPSELASGTLTPEQSAASDVLYAQKRAKEAQAKAKAQSLLRSGVEMPQEYRAGGRVRMI